MKNYFTIFIAVFLFTALTATAQLEQKYGSPDDTSLPDWTREMYKDSPDYAKVTELYKAYYKENKLVKNSHTQYYKRLQHDLIQDPYGVQFGFTTKEEAKKMEQNYLQRVKESNATRTGTTWSSVGPFDFDKGSASRNYAAGAAHVYTVEQSMSNPDILYAGTATAGLWKSTDKGFNWSLLTRDFTFNRVYAIEIDHSNPDVMYFDGQGDLFKTTDGGTTITQMGDATFQNTYHSKFTEIMMDPSNSNIVWALSYAGLFRTTNAGATWTSMMTEHFLEMEYHPTNNSILYAVRNVSTYTEFYKSTDGGDTWTIKTTGWPNPSTQGQPAMNLRVEIAVSPDDPNMVFAYVTGNANGGAGTYGVYVSTDLGESWSFKCCGNQPAGPPSSTNKNLMGWDQYGQDDGGQYYYDVGFAISPTNVDSVFVGGVNLWYSNDGGSDFNCPSKWSHSYKSNYVHADIHDIKIYGNDMWIACDGGVFYSDNRGATWNRRMFGIAGTDFWGFGAGTSNGDVMIGGTYHNGSLMKDNDVYENGWVSIYGGDNIRGHVNPYNDRIVFHDHGKLLLSGNRMVNYSKLGYSIRPKKTSNLEFHPDNSNIILSGINYSDLVKSTDGGATKSLVKTFSLPIGRIKYAPSNPDIIYVAIDDWGTDSKLMKTTDGGITWTDIAPSHAMLNNIFDVRYDFDVHEDNPDIIYLTRLRFAGTPSINGYMAYKTVNGGTSWTNITSPELDDELITNIAYQKGTDGGLYLGTRRTVYYKNNSMTNWVIYNSNLPLVTNSTHIDLDYYNGRAINGTNHSVHAVDFYSPSSVWANFVVNKNNAACNQETVSFVDNSVVVKNNANWSWTFNPSTVTYVNGTSATSQNPEVTFDFAGNYSVTLTVTDGSTSDTKTKTDIVTVTGSCTNTVINTFPYTQNFDTWGLSSPSVACTNDGSVVLGDYWSNLIGDDIDWDILSGSTASGGTGPTGDHTGSGNYLYTETSNCWNHTGSIITPTFDLTSLTSAQLTFWYNMYGANMGTMSIQVSTDGGANWSANIWSLSGNQGTGWNQATVSLNQYVSSDDVVIRFTGLTGSSYTSDMAIDDFVVESAVIVAPVADFSADNVTPNVGATVTFTDLSTENPTSWAWTFSPATVTYVGGTNATDQNPQLTFDAAGNYTVTLTATNTNGSDVEVKTDYISVNVPANLQLSNGVLTNVGSAWQTVTLSETYISPVVVCAANYSSGNVPAVARVRNASGNTFEVKVQNPQQISLSGYTVHYMVVEEGVYTDAADGVKMEAHKYTSTITDKKNSWVGESKSYSNSYSSPIVLGQVMTANDVDWSVFWTRGSASTNPPSSSAFYTGKHVGEETDAIRSNEEIGYIVIEAGTGTISNVGYSTGLGTDIVQGFDDSPPYIYTLSGLSTAGVAIVSGAAMDGGDGGWPALYGDSPVSTTSLNLTIDEDQIGDTERAHTTEQVAYIVFEGAASAPVAAFTANNLIPDVGETVTFTDSSTENPTSWAWTFSPATVTYVGGTTATDQNPQLTFDAAGNYTVTLTATNANGSDDEVKTDYIVASTSSCPAITSYPYTQNFDAWGLSSPTAACTSDGSVPLSDCWTNVVGDDIDWDIKSGSTVSGGTGPSGDHTGSGHYLYTESSICFNNTGSILTPTFDLSSLTSAQLKFWYNMYGANMGTMSIQVSTDGGANWSANIWSRSGNQGTGWNQATVSLSQYISDNVVIRFTGLTGSSYTSDMAIDDFVVEEIIIPTTVANFSANNVTPNVGATVTFTDSSTENPTSWAWTFSPATVTYVGGTSATDQNPQLTFDAAGNYTVTLTATNAGGSDDEVKTDYIVASSSSCPAITSYPYTQNFDAWGLSYPGPYCTNDGSVSLSDCWTNVVGEDIDWDIHSGNTVSGGTGASGDHTGAGNYLYTEASACFNHTGSILTPTFDLSAFNTAQLTFWYNMYGANMGTMSIQVSTDGGANWSANIWSRSGNQGTGWYQVTVSLSQYISADVVIRFTGLTGTNWTSDMAIDDIMVEVGGTYNPGNNGSENYKSNAINDEANIYSNKNIVYIQKPASMIGNITIYDMIGQKVITKKAGEETTIKIPIYKGMGYYVVRLILNDQVIVKKVFIEE